MEYECRGDQAAFSQKSSFNYHAPAEAAVFGPVLRFLPERNSGAKIDRSKRRQKPLFLTLRCHLAITSKPRSGTRLHVIRIESRVGQKQRKTDDGMDIFVNTYRSSSEDCLDSSILDDIHIQHELNR